MRHAYSIVLVFLLTATPGLAGVPEWACDAVIYQVLVDRFANGNPANDRSGEEPLPPSQNPSYRPTVNFMGGDLEGVTQKLPYLAELGVNCLWLTPVLRTPFYHGYHVRDYLEIDPHFGDEAALATLVREAHARGIRVLLDFVANHASEYHAAFQDALTRRESRFHDWFLWKSWPKEYERFYYFPDLPKWNISNRDVREHLVKSAEYWVKKTGVDGYRLDYAVGPGHEFWREFGARIGGDRFTLGEVWEDARTIASFGGSLHGCMDFPRQAVFRQFFAEKSITVDSFDRSMTDLRRIYGGMAMGSFLGNHDMPRFLDAARGDVWKVYGALIAQMTMDEVPIVYYGDEAMGPALSSGGHGSADGRINNEESDQATRRMMVWDGQQDASLRELFATLIRVRKALAPLRRGDTTTVWRHNDLGQYAYSRRLAGDTVVVALNNKADPGELPVPVASDGMWRDLLANRPIAASGGVLKVRLPGHWGAVLVPDSDAARELGGRSRIPAAVRRALGFDRRGTAPPR